MRAALKAFGSRAADPHRPITFTYDPLDRLLTETTSLGTVTCTYDTAGRRTAMTVSGQAPVTYAYDANARLRHHPRPAQSRGYPV